MMMMMIIMMTMIIMMMVIIMALMMMPIMMMIIIIVNVGQIKSFLTETNFKLLINSLHGATGPYVEAIFR